MLRQLKHFFVVVFFLNGKCAYLFSTFLCLLLSVLFISSAFCVFHQQRSLLKIKCPWPQAVLPLVVAALGEILAFMSCQCVNNLPWI